MCYILRCVKSSLCLLPHILLSGLSRMAGATDQQLPAKCVPSGQLKCASTYSMNIRIRWDFQLKRMQALNSYLATSAIPRARHRGRQRLRPVPGRCMKPGSTIHNPLPTCCRHLSEEFLAAVAGRTLHARLHIDVTWFTKHAAAHVVTEAWASCVSVWN